MRLRDGGFLQEARRFHDELVVVNGLDASAFDERLITNLRDGGVDVNMVGSTNRRLIAERPGELVHGTSVAAIERGVARDRIAIVFGFQQPDPFGEDLDSIADFHLRGLRSCGLAYNIGNPMGSGCVDPDPGGLSHLGVELVERLEAARIVVDVGGHCSEATSFDAIQVAMRPVVCSHTNVRSLRNTPRATTDELIRAIADRGGVIGITAFAFFVAEGRPTVADYVDHIDYVTRLVGVEHVGLGFDFIYSRERTGPLSSSIMFPPEAYPQTYDEWTYVEWLSNHSGAPFVTAALLDRGYPPADIEKIMGLNWLRVWKEVWGE